MAFPKKSVAGLLAQCHRRCCICHRFCGVKMELDHIVPKVDGGKDNIENAIPVCFECHAEIHLYNNKHPRGRKFSAEELQLHKKQWLKICQNRPEILTESPRIGDAGPLQALIDELEFNIEVSNQITTSGIGCLFETTQFDRSINEGIYSLLNNNIKNQLKKSYVAIKRANLFISALSSIRPEGNAYAEAKNRAQKAIIDTRDGISDSLKMIQSFLESSK